MSLLDTIISANTVSLGDLTTPLSKEEKFYLKQWKLAEALGASKKVIAFLGNSFWKEITTTGISILELVPYKEEDKED